VTPEDTQVPVAETPAAEETPAKETPAADAEPEEEEDNTYTYDQLLAQKAASAVSSDRKKARQVKNDGDWQEAVEVKFEKHIDARKCEEEEEQAFVQKNRKALSFDEFVTTKAKGRGRGGRNNNNEQRGGRQGRSERMSKLDDESAFPALGQN
jgi:hypothetical protein